ncbi:ABC transporter ATP-binding protein [Zafaria sp. Z1313]|uniref:ABC transporter ATP-binding protein n=1 Tax=unclassified Zafaria TaxID=2828765 RepID=UPI002E7846EF|nr:ABC transporter ATP-binding protein [Zafaria sp. J156]MEE1621844.1 ABC transporter ATP-binding protein [Zafaria sp. J156]
MTDPHLRLSGITKSYGRSRALADVDLDVAPGSTTAVVGPSGSGKTTLLRIIAGFSTPEAGRVELGGRTLLNGSGRPPVPAHRRNIGLVAQDGALFPHLSVGENVAFGLDRARFRGRAGRERVEELLDMVALGPEHAGRRPDQLSGGQQQRVALARALAREPELMLLDEPFSALDAGLRVATRKAVAATLARAGVTTVLVTHDQAEALSFADQVAVLSDGRLAQVGDPHTVYARPADLDTARFLGEAVVLDARLDGGLARCALGTVPASSPPGAADGALVELMLRPEQIRLVDSPGIAGTVVDADFFGSEIAVRIRLDAPDGGGPAAPQVITIRHWSAAHVSPGTAVFLRVDGEGVAYLP